MSRVLVSVIAVYISDYESIPRLKSICNGKILYEYKVIPLRVFTALGEKIYIDRVLDIRREASTKAGGLGIKYTCKATLNEETKEIFIFKDDDEWFLEEKF